MKILATGFLPRAHVSCHASSVLPRKDGTVLCAWFAGTSEGRSDVRIYLSRREGGIWSSPRMMSQTPGPNWNPVLYENERGEILLYYKTGRPIARWKTMLRVSRDGGRSFDDARELVPGDAGGRGPVRNHPIRARSGLTLAPASNEDGGWTAFCDISEDGGHTFVSSNSLSVPGVDEKGRGVIQPALWEDEGGIHMLLRSTEGSLYRSDSPDGRLWSPAYDTGIPNNNSGIDLCVLPDGRIVLAHNPVSCLPGQPSLRTPLTLSISEDGGHTFHAALTLAWENGEYSYPSVAFDGTDLHVTHTWKRQDIRYARVAI